MSKFETNRGNVNTISLSGVGYVVLPDNVSAAEYVQRCYRNRLISLGDGMGATTMHNVVVTEGILNDLQFPTSERQGSAVVWIRESYTNRVIAVGVLKTGEVGTTGRYQQRMVQEVGNQVAEILLDAMESRVTLSALGNQSVPGRVLLKATSGTTEGNEIRLIAKNKSATETQTYELRLSKDVDLLINDGEKNILTIVGNETEYHIKDNWGNEFILNEENCQILTPLFNVGTGQEHMVLGDTLLGLMQELIDAILQMTVLTHAGASGTCINAATFSDIKGRLDTMLSQLSHTD